MKNLIILSILIAVCATSNRLKMSIYYETLCPSSVTFIETVYSYYDDFKSVMDIEWIPYGHAKQKQINGVWHFKCQHGVDECNGNRYHACVLNLSNSSDATARFINCTIAQCQPSNVTINKACAEESDLDWLEIDKCFNGPEGNASLAVLGDKTRALEPKLYFVPTAVFNDKYDCDLDKKAKDNYTKTICSLLDEPKPLLCLVS